MYRPEELITTDLEWEYFLSALLSKEKYHGASGHLDLETWRGQIDSLFRTLRKAISANVRGDLRHRDQLLHKCEEARKRLAVADTIDKVTVIAVKEFARTCFELLGDFPEHWDRSEQSAAHAANWELDKLRTLRYERNDQQLFNQVIAMANQERNPLGLPSERELWRILQEDLKGSHGRFLEWLKSAHPNVALQLF